MKASSALTKPGDAARRESDKAVAFVRDNGGVVVTLEKEAPCLPGMPDSWYTNAASLTGDDWQPLHPAGELEAQNLWLRGQYSKVIDQFTHSLSKPTYPAELVIEHMQAHFRERVDEDIAEAFEEFGGIEKVRKMADASAGHAAEVKRLTAERDEARRERDSFREKRDAARAKGRLAAAQAVERDRAIDALTARVAELEASIEKFGSCIFNTRGDLEHVELGTDQLNALMAEFVRHFPSPLPTAGEEGKSWAWSKEDSERRKKVEAWVEATDPDMIRRGLEDIEAGRVVPLEDVIAEEAPAPAEPDSPAEERPSKLRDESWVREAADAEDHHASVCAGDMPPRKPDCLANVPAVLCESGEDGDTYQWWLYGPIDSFGYIAAYHALAAEVDRYKASDFTPIHHDPTDAAAEALRSEIEEGGGR